MNLNYIPSILRSLREVKWSHWLSNTSYTILDQFFFSGSNFTLNILLARWLSPENYGSFALLFSILLFFSGFHVALLVEPMSVLGVKYRDNLNQYYLHSFKIHFIVTGTITFLVIIVATFTLLFNVDKILISKIIWMSLVLPLVLFIWFQRRFFYLQQKPNVAFKISTLYSLLLIVSIVVLNKNKELLSVVNIFLLMGFCSLASSFGFGLPYLRKIRTLNSKLFTKIIFIENWRYGKWIFLVVFVQWLSSNFYILLTASIMTTADVGGYRAVQNFTLPILQIIAALGLFFLPWSAQQFSDNTISKFKQKIIYLILGLFTLSGIYVLFIWLFDELLFKLMYGGKYIELAKLLPYFLTLPFFVALNNSLQIGLKAQQKSKVIFKIYFVSALFTLTGGTLLVYTLGLLGVAIGSILTALTQSIVTFYYWKKS